MTAWIPTVARDEATSLSKCCLDWLDHGELTRIVPTPDRSLDIESEMAQ
jgi:hypothetical protein